jgi:hypothetical protein
MELKDDVELANTKRKLQRLEGRYQASLQETDEEEHVRRLSQRSLNAAD